MKILKWIFNNFLFIFTLFLLAFIPLYPKIPLIDIKNTWVYVRAEDFVVVSILILWVILILLKKVSIKTPLAIPILIFWTIGGLATLHGVLVLFPTLADVFPNVAFLSFLRRLEYMSLFFIAFASIQNKKSVFYIVVTLAVVLILIVGYGFGQKFLGFPAFLTMNEEFAKGVPIRLSELSRVPSTFAGHYDLAAYLVLVIPILVSMIFGFKNVFFKIFLLFSAFSGFVLLFMTVSRVSFFVLLLSLVTMLILQKKKLIIISLFVLTVILLIFSPSLLDRFKSTFTEVNVLVDAKTGGAIGQVKEVPSEYFRDKIIKKVPIPNIDAKNASVSAILPFSLVPAIVPLIVEGNNPTGENLPQGTSYVNLPLSPVIKKVNEYFYQKSTDRQVPDSREIRVFYGDYLIKRARAYDLSFTTRFQGEWPRTFTAFKRNILLGSGYGSVSLAVDNNYLRILGESGLLGLASFISIFVVAVIYVKKLLPKVTSPVIKSFVIGFIAGSFGLALNAILIDVFDASKIAFTYWILMGIVIGILHFYKTEEIDFLKEFKRAVISPYAIIIYIFVTVAVFFFPSANNYFVGDDFTWFRWVQDCCNNIYNYFTDSNGFFYRPGAKIYFSLMYQTFWFNQTMYHLFSILLHFAVSALLFLVLKKILRNYFLSIVAVILFIVSSGHHEAIFWISSTGFLFSTFFALASLLSFMLWKEKKRSIYLIISLISIILGLMFHELGIVIPLLIIMYDLIYGQRLGIKEIFKKRSYLILLFPILPYLILRFIANSHWFSGDYSYNIFKLPYNIIGNAVGYFLLDLLGPQVLSIYQLLRNFSRDYILIALPIFIFLIIASIYVYKKIMGKINENDKKVIIFGFLFFAISLLPFLGLGNITSRYSYLSSIGFVILFVILLKNIYFHLVNISGKYIGLISIILIMIVYSMIQLFGLQKIHTDWYVAGEKAKRFLIAIEEYAKDYWTRDSMQFYFVNVPIRNGEAWVFPVGLSDAMWFTFKNPNLSVYTLTDINQAFNLAASSPAAHVFLLDENGNTVEVIRTLSGKIAPVTPLPANVSFSSFFK